MPDVIDPTTGASVLPEEQVPATEEKVTSVEEEPEVTPPLTTTPPAPSQELDPIAELDKLQLDPKVKETLKAGYLRQSDYTKKTQEIAESRKAAEAYQYWSPIIGFLEKNPAIANSLFKRNPADAPPADVDYPDDPKEFAKAVRAEAIADMKAEMKAELTRRDEATAQDQRFTAEIAQAEKLDERLSTDDEFAKQITGLIKVNFEDDIRSGKMSVMEATQHALDAHKAYEENLRQKVLTDMNDKAKKKTTVIPGGSGSPLATAPKGGKMSMREAAAEAEETLSRS